MNDSQLRCISNSPSLTQQFFHSSQTKRHSLPLSISRLWTDVHATTRERFTPTDRRLVVMPLCTLADRPIHNLISSAPPPVSADIDSYYDIVARPTYTNSGEIIFGGRDR